MSQKRHTVNPAERRCKEIRTSYTNIDALFSEAANQNEGIPLESYTKRFIEVLSINKGRTGRAVRKTINQVTYITLPRINYRKLAKSIKIQENLKIHSIHFT